MQEPSPRAPAHDSFTRLLQRIEPDPETLWDEARDLFGLIGLGYFGVVDRGCCAWARARPAACGETTSHDLR